MYRVTLMEFPDRKKFKSFIIDVSSCIPTYNLRVSIATRDLNVSYNRNKNPKMKQLHYAQLIKLLHNA